MCLDCVTGPLTLVVGCICLMRSGPVMLILHTFRFRVYTNLRNISANSSRAAETEKLV